jgi:hypothetical protein
MVAVVRAANVLSQRSIEARSPATSAAFDALFAPDPALLGVSTNAGCSPDEPQAEGAARPDELGRQAQTPP